MTTYLGKSCSFGLPAFSKLPSIYVFSYFPFGFEGRMWDLIERGGSVVECRTPEREVRGSRPTAAVLCP